MTSFFSIICFIGLVCYKHTVHVCTLHTLNQLYILYCTEHDVSTFIVLVAVRETCDSEAEDAIRLTQSTRETAGRLEVCFDGYWGSVCGIGATDTIADVACRQLNYATGGMMCNYIVYNTVEN